MSRPEFGTSGGVVAPPAGSAEPDRPPAPGPVAPDPAAAERVWDPGGPVDVVRTLAPLRRGRFDPCMAVVDGAVWRASNTPEGPVTTHVGPGSGGGVRMRAWGPGAAWALAALPSLLGADDDAGRAEFAAMALDPAVADLRRRHPDLRICRSGAVLEALVPSIIEQKVVGRDARAAYAALVRARGRAAPAAPGAPAGLMVPPDAPTLAATPSYVFHRANLERRRGDAIRLAAGAALRLEETVVLPLADFYRRATALPGIGPWTAAEVAVVALGDPDAVSVGDYHLPNFVAWALAGEPRADDDRMLEFLEPYRPHRARVLRLLLAGLRSPGGRGAPPRYGPRLPRQSIVAF